MKKLRAGLSALLIGFFTVASLVIAAQPAHADLWDDYAAQNKLSNDVKYKYSFDYKNRTWGPSSAYTTPQTVSPTVHNSYPAPTRPAVGSNTPISGKIIQPGQTVVRIPSTYVPPSGWLPSALKMVPWASRLLGTAGLGLGSTTVSPGNWKQLAVGQGVPQSCVDDMRSSSCTADHLDKIMVISGCGMLTGAQSCDAIGATAPDGSGSPGADWFKNSALPFLDDLWAQITGQNSNPEIATDFVEVTGKTWGCDRQYAVQYRGDNNITLHVRSNIIAARPSTSPGATYWDSKCSTTALSKTDTSNTQVRTVCLDNKGRTEHPTNGTVYGMSIPPTDTRFEALHPGKNLIALCNTTAAPTADRPVVLFKVRIGNVIAQSNYTGPSSINYAHTKYSEWTNPDVSLNSIEDTTVTTTWDCKTVNGTIYTYTKTLAKVAAFVGPECPPGSTLEKHEVKSATKNGGTNTLDQGQSVPSELAKYPDCGAGTMGCSLQIFIDGSACVVGQTACMTWPSVNASTPSRVTCKWGSYTVPTANCNVIANGYQSETGVVFDPNSGTWIAIDVHGNPIAPNPEPWNPVNPNPAPGVAPGTVTPTTPGSTTPGPVTIPGGEGANCWPGGSAAFNPLEWVLSPVKCALQWAFVPTEAVAQTEMTRIQTQLGKVGVVGAVGTVTTTMNTVGAAAGGGTGCEGPTFHFDYDVVHEEIQPFNACAEPVATMAAISRAFTTVVVIILGLFGVVRALGASVGFGFSMGKSSS